MKSVSSRDKTANDAENKPELQIPSSHLDKTWHSMNHKHSMQPGAICGVCGDEIDSYGKCGCN
jgi:hypothetical protein